MVTRQQRQVDPRGSKLCSNCNMPRPPKPAMHCASGRCGWWKCPRCQAWNDSVGRNNKTDPEGRSKDGVA